MAARPGGDQREDNNFTQENDIQDTNTPAITVVTTPPLDTTVPPQQAQRQTLLPGAPAPAPTKCRSPKRCAVCVKNKCRKRLVCPGRGGKALCRCGHPPMRKGERVRYSEEDLELHWAEEERALNIVSSALCALLVFEHREKRAASKMRHTRPTFAKKRRGQRQTMVVRPKLEEMPTETRAELRDGGVDGEWERLVTGNETRVVERRMKSERGRLRGQERHGGERTRACEIVERQCSTFAKVNVESLHDVRIEKRDSGQRKAANNKNPELCVKSRHNSEWVESHFDSES
ncbi:hypothetical protein R3P38DRAFT_2774168 [Favolaschia claudopus]|uniref:Zn(2)-C6 fungal-type domain-containing protein n=1 Tax=Favolaschia claudopus TaxID=2862362 RepID=A0AAW0BXX1_9AGAR